MELWRTTALPFGVQNFSMSQDRLRDVDALERDLEELLAIFRSAEAFSG